jgi:LPXTG-site transpeptidase (sortase) family protein
MRALIAVFVSLLLVLTGVAQLGTTDVTRLNSVQVFTGPLDAVDFSPNSALLASGGRDNSVRLWSASTGENLMTISGHEDWVTSIAFNADGSLLASGSRDNSIRLWDARTGKPVRVIGHHRGDVTALAFTPAGNVLASAGRDGSIKLWHIETATLIQELENYGGPVWDVQFSHDGRVLASGSEDGVVWLWGLWDAANGPWLKRVSGHQGPVTRLAFSDDDTLLLSGGLDSTLRLWDIATDKTDTDINSAEIVMRGHAAPIMGLGFAADNQMATSASLDGTFRLWDIGGRVQRGAQLSMVTGNGAPLTQMALNKTRTSAASVGTDGVMNVWDVSSEALDKLINGDEPATLSQNPNPEAIRRPTTIPQLEQLPNPTATIPAPVTVPTLRPTIPSPTPQPAIPTARPTRPQPAAPVQPNLPAPSGGRQLIIPSIGLNSPVTTFYLDGVSWAIDPWEHNAGHFQGTAWLNQVGNVAIGAHSEYPNGQPGLFANLYNVGIGDEIYVRDGGIERRYVVVNILTVDYRDLSVVYPTSHNRVTLVTCDIPSYVAEQGIYYERLVIHADEV